MPFDGAGFVISDNRLNQLDDVIQLIGRPERWCQGRRRTRDGRFCIYGGLVEVNARNLSPVILQAIHEVTGRPYRCIEAFNDDIGTTHPLVLRVLSRARGDLTGYQAKVYSFPQTPKWCVRLQEWVQSFAVKSPT